MTLLIVAFVAAVGLRHDSLAPLARPELQIAAVVSAAVGVGTLWLVGFYRTIVRFISRTAIEDILAGATAAALASFLMLETLGVGASASLPVIQALVATLAIGGTRYVLRAVYASRIRKGSSQQRVVIYGAGESGRQLYRGLQGGLEYVVMAFVDDDRALHGVVTEGLRVHPPADLPGLIESYGVDLVLLAMPSVPVKRRHEILGGLERLPVQVKTIPGIADIISGDAKINQIADITPEDLLGREPVAPDHSLFAANIEDRSVMVTGAGGSIGSELCRQILSARPRLLVLFELSEYALFTIEQELGEKRKALGLTTEIVAIMGSVQNRPLMELALRRFGVQTLYHAAAYKHVPLVEHNVVEGVRNNVFGTLTAAQAAEAAGVDVFILVSTDKAVRPTNVMGASKRFAELACQALADRRGKTRFSMVRFGNVMGSSGSVIPRFRQQISEGGPVTVTHPDVTRYFMTIPEAAQLVIQAGAMGRGGDVFLLDMGEPVKIVDLATTMIRLSGLQPVIGGEAPEDGRAIRIEFCGLRDGEKLYEELLVDAASQPTRHPRIMSASETFLPWDQLEPMLQALSEACAAYDVAAIRTLLLRAPLGYQFGAKITDHLWLKGEAARPQGGEVVSLPRAPTWAGRPARGA